MSILKSFVIENDTLHKHFSYQTVYYHLIILLHWSIFIITSLFHLIVIVSLMVPYLNSLQVPNILLLNFSIPLWTVREPTLLGYNISICKRRFSKWSKCQD